MTDHTGAPEVAGRVPRLTKVIGDVMVSSDCTLREVLVAYWEPEYPRPEETAEAETQADRVLNAVALAVKHDGNDSPTTTETRP